MRPPAFGGRALYAGLDGIVAGVSVRLKPLTPAEFGITERAAPLLENRARIASVLALAADVRFGQSQRINGRLQRAKDRALAAQIESARTDQAKSDLESMVRRRIDEASKNLAGDLTLQGAKQEEIDLIEQDFERARLEGPCCGRCETAHVCNDSDIELDIVEINGNADCLKILRESFNVCAEQTNKIYASHAPWCTGERRVTATFRDSDQGVVGLNAVTKFDKRGVTVTVDLPVCTLTAESYVALWWIMLHELGVHAMQECHLHKEPAKAGDCAFTEGLVDRTVVRGFQQRDLGADESMRLGNVNNALDQFLNAVQAHRCNGTGGLRATHKDNSEGQRVLEQYKRGYAAFHTLERIFAADGFKRLAGLVLSLNLLLNCSRPRSDAPSERDRFISFLEHVADGSVVRQRDEKDKTVAVVDQYAAAAELLKSFKPNRRRRPDEPLRQEIEAVLAPAAFKSKALSAPNGLPQPR
jgi:hypothetical protein